MPPRSTLIPSCCSFQSCGRKVQVDEVINTILNEDNIEVIYGYFSSLLSRAEAYQLSGGEEQDLVLQRPKHIRNETLTYYLGNLGADTSSVNWSDCSNDQCEQADAADSKQAVSQ